MQENYRMQESSQPHLKNAVLDAVPTKTPAAPSFHLPCKCDAGFVPRVVETKEIVVVVMTRVEDCCCCCYVRVGWIFKRVYFFN